MCMHVFTYVKLYSCLRVLSSFASYTGLCVCWFRQRYKNGLLRDALLEALWKFPWALLILSHIFIVKVEVVFYEYTPMNTPEVYL